MLAVVVVAVSPSKHNLAAQPATGGVNTADSSVPSLDSLLAQLHEMPGLKARFREEKRMALLAKPLVSEGTLHFAPPAKLARYTKYPVRSWLVIDEHRIGYGDELGGEQLNLDRNPAARLFVDSFMNILAGNRSALERIYDIDVTPRSDGAAGWQLVLVPLVAPLRDVIERVEVQGRASKLDGMRVVEVVGDETLTTFFEVDVQHRYRPDELEKIFRLPNKRSRG